MDKAWSYIGILLSALYFVSLGRLILKNRKAKRRIEISDSPIEGTDADRKAAEEKLALSDQELRAELLKTHVLIERLSTLDGFTEEYMDDLVKEFDSSGIRTTYFFQQVVPLGVTTLIKAHGIYEFYADATQAEQASKLLDRRLQST